MGVRRWFWWAKGPSGPLAASVSPSAEQSSLTPSAFSVAGDGVTSIDLDVEALDEQGQPLAGVVTVVSQEIVRASVANSQVIAAGTIEANTSLPVTIKIQDADGHPIPDVAAADIGLTSTGTGNTIGAFSGRTNDIGEISTTFESSVEESKTLTGTIEGSNITATATVVVGDPPTPPAPGDPDYETDFEGSTTLSDHNADGFTWGGLNDTAVVDVSGNNKLRFRYDAGVQAEQRWTLNPPGAGELWIEYDWTIPANFVHNADSPSNNKFLQVWNTVYGSGSLTWQVGYEFQLVGGVTCIRPMSSKETGTNSTFVTSSGLGHPDHNKQFIGGTGPCSPGNTYQIRHHLKKASANEATDGAMEMWVDGELFAQMTNGPFRNHTTSPDYESEPLLKQGYFMGTANAQYDEETDFHIDNVKFYTTDPEW